MTRISFPACLVAVLVSAVSPSGHQQDASSARVVHVVAERFAFTPSRITLEQGTTVELRITSDDTAHGFKLATPDGVDVEIPKRGRGDRRVLFTASEAGTFAFECSRVCGAGHGFMRGEILVKAASRGEGRP
jgi:heme/copper-type cytochrome/quinol oxidase subunit 2